MVWNVAAVWQEHDAMARFCVTAVDAGASQSWKTYYMRT